MKSKKLLVLLIAGAMLMTSLTACSTAPTQEEEPSATQVVTQLVTNEQGETVTEVVTDANGDTVTEVVSTTEAESTTKAESTTAQSTSKKETTTKKSNNESTTKKKPASTKPTTTQKADNSIPIVLEKNLKASCSSPNVTIEYGSGINKKPCVVEITKPGDYVFTQKTGKDAWRGQIILKLKNSQKASLRFENVNISAETKNIIQIIDASIDTKRTFLERESATGSATEDVIEEISENDKAPNVSISFPEGTSSKFESSSNAYTGVLYNESKLTIKGKGAVSILSTENANNCICSTKSITIKNVSLTLETAHNTPNSSGMADTTGSAKGIFSYNKVNLESGVLTIKTNGDAIRCTRFTMDGGTANLKSASCDAIDANNSIVINGGTMMATALDKYSFKVRRVNNTEKHIEEGGEAKGLVRSGEGDCFKINGGKVTGESKKITSLARTYQSDNSGSKQPNVTAKIIKANAGNADLTVNESKVPAIIKIGSWTSKNECTKFLYSSSSVVKGKQYSVKANGKNAESLTWTGNAGVALIKNSKNV